jgi:Domain of unknown function (DUF7025)
MSEHSFSEKPGSPEAPDLIQDEDFENEEDFENPNRFELEGRYIDLLERRIAALESRRTLSTDAEGLMSVRQRLKSYYPSDYSGRHGRGLKMIHQKSKYERVLFTGEAPEHRRGGTKNHDYESRARVIWKSPPSKMFTDEKKHIDARHAFEWHQIMDSRGEEIHLEVRIIDDKLKKLIASQLYDYPGHWDQEQMVFRDNLCEIVFNLDRFEPLLEGESCPNPWTRDDLRLLLEMIRKAMELKPYFDNLEMAKKDGTVAFDDLWTLFPPGELVFGSPLDEPQVFIVHDFSYSTPSKKSDIQKFTLYCWRYGILHFSKPTGGSTD